MTGVLCCAQLCSRSLNTGRGVPAREDCQRQVWGWRNLETRLLQGAPVHTWPEPGALCPGGPGVEKEQ